MAATSINKYKITIKLTNNDENDDKEYIIDNMKQILLQHLAEKEIVVHDGSSDEENKYIFMLKDSYYIDNDVLKSIRGSKGEKKYEFKNFATTKAEQIINEFYTPILTNNDNSVKIEILTQILLYAKASIEYSDKIADNSVGNYAVEKKKRKAKIALLTEKITAITSLSTDKDIEAFIKNFDDVIKILVDTNVMSYLKSIYDNTNDNNKDTLAFRQNLSNIMLKIKSNTDTKLNLNKVEPYHYFLDPKYIETIFETIQNNISTSSRNAQQQRYGYRPNLLNTPEMFKQIIKENIKYVYPDKTNIETLAESEEQDILLFHNILYIIKKIYLLDTTIISYKETYNMKNISKNISKKFYIKNLTLEQYNPFKLDKIKSTGKEFYNAFINFKCDIKYINQNPTLKINYIIDDIEILDKTNHLKIIEFDPKNFNKAQEFKKYNSTYIYDTFDYKANDSKINKILNTIKMQRIIKTKEELFYNDIALNELNELLEISFKKSNKSEKTVSSNILYFLKNILKLYNGKEITDANGSYFVYDTLIISDINDTNPLNFYSISQNKTTNYKNFKAEKIQKNIFKKFQSLQLTEVEPYYSEKFNVYKVESKDNRIERNTYYIFILFTCYKADEKGNRPSFTKRVIGEVCLERAKILDNAFHNLFYSKLNIPETFLYNKLLNLQKSKQATTVKNKEITDVKNQNKEPPTNLETLETKIKGGKKKYTRKIKLSS